MEPPVLTDGIVTLRALGDQDVAGVLEQCLDPQSIRWTQVPVPFGLGDAIEFVHEIAPGAWADGSQWILAVEGPDGYVGNVALRDERHGRAEIAYGAHPAARGRGLMEAGLRLLLEWGFATQGIETVVWRADVGNWASRKLAWRLGFHLDGVLRGSQFSRGRLVDAWVGTLLAGDERTPSGRWLSAPELTGEEPDHEVRLRALRDDDVPRIVEACSDERTRRWLGRTPSPYGPGEARAFLERITGDQASGSGTAWAVTARDDDRLVASFEVFDVSAHACEIGYWTHPDARGRGVMTTAARLATSYAFDELGVRRVLAHTAVDNTASRHVLEAAGFRDAGVVRLGTTTRTGRADAAVYDVLVEEWRSSRR
ncbi:GNAT family N-acetyltransferase [Nocardioides sp. C4-1]|uniref:GNAT family N-acetyltransferase n=1 Tax=Nocardioides sp. C4-1 TaxID=3151851 RepID=UPI003265C580